MHAYMGERHLPHGKKPTSKVRAIDSTQIVLICVLPDYRISMDRKDERFQTLEYFTFREGKLCGWPVSIGVMRIAEWVEFDFPWWRLECTR